MDSRHTASARNDCMNPWVMRVNFNEFASDGFAHPFASGSWIPWIREVVRLSAVNW